MILNQVFWTTLLMGLIVATYSKTVTQYAIAVNKSTDSIQARFLAQSGIELGLAKSFQTRALAKDRVAGSVATESGEIFIDFESERGKIDLNFASIEMIIRSFELLPINLVEREKLIRHVQSFRKKSVQIKSIDEFFMAIELDRAAFEIALKYYSVVSGISSVDIKRAHPNLANWLKTQNHPDWVQIASGGGFRIISTGRTSSGSEHTIAAIFEPKPLQNPPYRLSSWRTLKTP